MQRLALAAMFSLLGLGQMSAQDPPAVDGKSLREWAASLLDPAQRFAAVGALRKADPADGLAALVDAIAGGEPEAAWQAMRIVRLLTPAAEHRAAFASSARKLGEIALASEQPLPRRVSAALALGDLLPHAEREVESLLALGRSSSPTEVRIAGGIALGGGGAAAAKHLAKLRHDGDMATGVAFLAAICLLEKYATPCRARVRDIIDKDEGMHPFLLARAAQDTLVAIGASKAADEAWTKLVQRCRGGNYKFTAKKINPVAFMPAEPPSAALYLNQTLGSPCPANANAYSVPDEFPPPIGKNLGTADVIGGLAMHCVKSVRSIGARHRTGALARYEDWQAAVGPIAVTMMLLAAVE